MVGLRTLERTAVFAWSPGNNLPLLVTGTRVGALSDDFSSETKLELWDLGLDKGAQDPQLEPLGSIATDAGFNDVAWSEPNDEHPLGVIAGALENGSVDLWDAQKLRNGDSGAFISRTTKHSGPVKALQWNMYRHNLLASVGAKGEIFIYDLNNMSNPFRLGASAARADDLECLDWNKSEKTAHILATGSSGGFVTVWDVKQKKDILTLHNQGRKAVSAVAWDPEQSTKLATATSNDQEPVILIWSLRNASAPEQTLRGHELGVLGLSWCVQDPELLLSCGKDNRTICWNAKTAEKYGDFAAGSNWAFQTRWCPHNPTLIASASFDGKILITSTQSTNSKSEEQGQASQSLDGEDFFAKAQTQPQDISFSLRKAPKWAARPVTASFGFGGKIVIVSTDASKKSKVSIQPFVADSSISEAAQAFESKLSNGDIGSICEGKINEAKTEEEKADWQVIDTLNAGKSRKKLREYLGFEDEATNGIISKTEALNVNGDGAAQAETNGDGDDFFTTSADNDNFLANLASAKGARTNNPFSIYTGSESDADQSITRALMLGQFENALDVCLKEDRISDAFMIAVCGGQKCIDKAQNAYLKMKADSRPNYLRLLASIVGKNLWDIVHNADLANWKDVMATLCTYADETEFPDLCEELGDRLEEAYQDSKDDKGMRRNASFCYLAGSKLEKVVTNWVQELSEQEGAALEAEDGENAFSLHAKCLQDFVEKVSVFRKVTNFQDSQSQGTSEWKLAPLYGLYSEYADILAAQGYLSGAESYLNLLPPKYNGAEASQARIKQALRKANVAATQQKRTDNTSARTGARIPAVPQAGAMPVPQPLINSARNMVPDTYAPPNAQPSLSAPQAPYTANTVPAPGQYAPATNTYPAVNHQMPQQTPLYGQPAAYGGYQQQPQQQIPLPPPPRAGTASPAVPPASAVRNMSNWNDMPENFLNNKPNSRRGTPGPQAVTAPFPNAAPQQIGSPAQPFAQAYSARQAPSPLPPPPKAGEAAPRMTSPPTTYSERTNVRPGSSSAANAYAPPTQYSVGSTLPNPAAPPPLARGASPYQPPPSISTAAPSNRYAPAPGSVTSPGPGGMPAQRQVAPNPYVTQQQPGPYAPQQQGYGQPLQAQGIAPGAPPPQGPPRAQAAPPAIAPPPQGPPRAVAPPPRSQPPSQQQPNADARPSSQPVARPTSAQPQTKYPRGDRSHISPSAQPIVDILTPDISRIKAVAPPQFKPQVDDMEKRLSILFDHLNNEDLLSEVTVQRVVQICEAIRARDWDGALAQFTELQSSVPAAELGQWSVGVKRLINMGKISKI